MRSKINYQGGHGLAYDVADWCDRNLVSHTIERKLIDGLSANWTSRWHMTMRTELAVSFSGDTFREYLHQVVFGDIYIENLGNAGMEEVTQTLQKENDEEVIVFVKNREYGKKIEREITQWCHDNNIHTGTQKPLLRGVSSYTPRGLPRLKSNERRFTQEDGDYYDYLRSLAKDNIRVFNVGEKMRAEISRALANENKLSKPEQVSSPKFVTLTVTVPFEYGEEVLGFVKLINENDGER